MSQHAKLRLKVAECEQLMNLAETPRCRISFMMVHRMWLDLIDESTSMPLPQLMNEIAAIDEIQSTVVGINSN
jgi:hypothetical protein